MKTQTRVEVKPTRRQLEAKKTKLLSVPQVRRWYEDVQRGSKNTAETWISRLSRFLEKFQLTPIQLAQLDKETATNLIHDYIRETETELAPQTIKGTVTSVKSYLRFSNVEITKKFKIRKVSSTPTLRGRKLPNGQELSELYSRANLRQATIISFVAKAGVRPEVLGWCDATDGLTVEDLPDLAIVQGLATFTKYPSRVMVRDTLSKTGKPYFTFLTTEGAKKVIAYLNDRILHGESLRPDSPVIAPSRLTTHRGANIEKPFINTPVITKDVRKALQPRFRLSPYDLRRFFEQRLSVAEADGKITHEWRQFFAGHKGDMEAVYAFGCELPPNVIERMRDAYKSCEPYLDLEVSGQDDVEKKKQEVHTAIESLSPERLAEVLELVKQLADGKTSESSGPMMQNSSSIKVGSSSELYQTEKLSSKNRVRSLCKSGPEGIRTLDLTLRKRSHYPSCATSPIHSLCQIFKNVWKDD